MFADEKKLLMAERRGRALAIALKPQSAHAWRVSARPDPDGAALLAASRWARRFGARVEISASGGDGAPAFWNRLAEYPFREALLRHTAGETADDSLVVSADGLEMRIRNIPSDAEAWSRALTDSWRMVGPASDSSPRMGAGECRSVDSRAIGRFGVAGICLMENAALAALAVARDMLGECRGGRVLIAVGGGNNGGDGLALARGLSALGIACEAALLKPADGLSGDSLVNYRLLRELPVPVHEIHDIPRELEGLSRRTDLIVDALLGTGFKGALSDSFQIAVDAINRSGKPTLALDIPSGLDGDSGSAAGLAVRADRTVTFAAVKNGLERGRGPAHTGRLFVGDIGAPAEALGKVSFCPGQPPANG